MIKVNLSMLQTLFYEIQKILEYHRTDHEYTLSPLVEIILVYI